MARLFEGNTTIFPRSTPSADSRILSTDQRPMATSTSTHSGRTLPALELGTLLILVALTFWSVRPLLEEWGLLHALNAQGIRYVGDFMSVIPMRPLHLVPSVLYWGLGQGHPFGVALGSALLLLMRYWVARWAVSPLLHGYDRWVLASLAAVLVVWPGAWLGRFAPAQLSAVLFFAALGFSIRLHQQWSIRSAIGCVASILGLLCMYQALALCLVAAPFFSLLWHRPDERLGSGARNGVFRVGVPIASAFILYGVYALIVSRSFGGGGYEGTLAASSGRLLTVTGLATHIGRAYSTAFFGSSTLALPILLLLASYIFLGASQTSGGASTSLRRIGLALALVLTLPLFSLVYLNDAHIGDPDRVLFPVATAFVLVVASLMARNRAPSGHASLALSQAGVVVMVLLAASVVSAVQVKRYATLQETVMSQTLQAIKGRQQPPQSLLIQDATGVLGDVYTYLNPLFTDALAVHGHEMPATICTLNGIDRIHPDAQRYPIDTTQRCADAPVTKPSQMILTVRREDGRLTVRP